MPIHRIDWPGSPIAMSDVAALEERLAVKLPADYRAFLLQHNGGRPMPDAFPIPGGEHPPDGGSLMDEFLGVVTTADREVIDGALRTFASRIPTGLLPIGYDAGGNVICLGIDPDNHGRVFFWDHDFEEDLPTWNNVYPLAESFQSFLASFRERPKV
jgi:cell wall assembly regulator SMI1